AASVFFEKELESQTVMEGKSVLFSCEVSSPNVPKPKDTVVMEGETATLSCTTSDLTTLVTWKRNHIPLRNGDKYEMRKEGKVNLLLIRDVDPLDTGVYSCDTGDMQSTHPHFCPFSPELPPFFQEELQSVEAEEGASATLYLSKPGLSVQWKKNKLPLRANRKYEMKQDGCLLQLHIKELKPEDSGSYSCRAGAAETAATLTVQGVCSKKSLTFFPIIW
uniref:Ig-like domain-containing protein n=2 Tax=Oreochromis TaxID=8139 RepID=A0A669CZ63_ORENI